MGLLSNAFHTGNAGSLANAGTHLSKPGQPLVRVLHRVAANMRGFGPAVFSAACSLLADMINSDPSSVEGVHDVGLAKALCVALQKYECGGQQALRRKGGADSTGSVNASASANTSASDGNDRGADIGVDVEAVGIPLPVHRDVLLSVPPLLSALGLTSAGAKSLSFTHPWLRCSVVFTALPLYGRARAAWKV